MNIHLVTEVNTYLETPGIAEPGPILSRSQQADTFLRMILQIDPFDPANSALVGVPIMSGDLVTLRTSFGDFFQIDSANALRANPNLTGPVIPDSVFRIEKLEGASSVPIRSGDRVAFRAVLLASPVGPMILIDSINWMTVDRDDPDHAISFREVGPLDDLRATERFRLFVPVKISSLAGPATAVVPYDSEAVAGPTLSVDSAGTPGGSLFDIHIDGDPEDLQFVESTDFSVALPEGQTHMTVNIDLAKHLGDLSECLDRRIEVTATAVATGTPAPPKAITLKAGHIPFMRMRQVGEAWVDESPRGCLARLFPGVFTSNDMLFHVSLILIPHDTFDPTHLPISDIKISSEDPALLVLPLLETTLTFDQPLEFTFVVKNLRRQTRPCRTLLVDFTLAGGKVMKAQFAVLLRNGAISVDPSFTP
jgi:hypothetical protein